MYGQKSRSFRSNSSSLAAWNVRETMDSACQNCSASELSLVMCLGISVACEHDVIINASETKRRERMSVTIVMR
jgi:hypothetical protein